MNILNTLSTMWILIILCLISGQSFAQISGMHDDAISDSDKDTGIQTEKNPGENIIRFDIKGIEKMALMNNNYAVARLELYNYYSNLLIGDQAGANLRYGTKNLLLGYHAGEALHNHYQNTILGYGTGRYALGNENVLIGNETASYLNGNHNVFIGSKAGNGSEGSPTGNFNVAVGSFSGSHDGAGSENVHIGYKAGQDSESTRSTIVGNEAGGSAGPGGGNNQVAVGYRSGYNNTTGYQNTFVGDRAGYNNTGGLVNVYLGSLAGYESQNGYYNSFTGYRSGYYDELGNRNSAYGAVSGISASASSSSFEFSTALGAYARYTASHQVRVGRSNTTSIGGYQSWTNLSDGRYKTRVREDVPGLDFVMKLRPVTYKVDIEKLNELLYREEEIRDLESNNGVKTQGDPSSAKEIIHSGFIAQEVEETAQNLGYEFSGVDAPKNEEDHYGLRYATFVVPMVKAIQEQQVLIETQQELIKQLQSELQQIRDQIQTSHQASSNKQKNSDVNLPILQQEQISIGPNPVSESLIVRINSQEVQELQLALSNLQGQQLLIQRVLLNPGENKLELDTRSFSAGIYLLSFPQTNLPEFKVVKQ
ncbi:MAG: tail fiber domain-containing protein [Bacteroidota bacterium]